MVNKDIYLLLGTNLGDRCANLEMALKLISERAGKILKMSSVLETDSWGFECETKFLNQAIHIESGLNPFELLQVLQKIEKDLGRSKKKSEVYESRIIDIDILYYGVQIINEDRLNIPHPHLQHRFFALKPLNEIASQFVHPVLKENTETLLSKIV